MIRPFHRLVLLTALGASYATASHAAEIVVFRPGPAIVPAPAVVAEPVVVAQPVIVAEPAIVRVKPPHRYLTSYLANYPFGVLREDYTPLGAPGVSKAAYFGRPMLTATLHVSPRRHWRYDRVIRERVLVRARY